MVCAFASPSFTRSTTLDISHELRYTVSMTRKHFNAIAAAIASSADDSRYDRYTRQLIANQLATEFEQFNPNFDRARFIKACRVEA